MQAKVLYNVQELQVTPEEREHYKIRASVQNMFYLVRSVYLDGKQISIERISFFNFDSEAALFQTYLNNLHRIETAHAKCPTQTGDDR